MNEEFRHKLLQWMTSGLLLLAIAALSLGTAWFAELNRIAPYFDNERSFPDLLAQPLGESLIFYPFVLPPLLLWHLADFSQLDRPTGKRLRFLTGYPVLSCTLLALGVAFILQTTGWFRMMTEGYCGQAFIIFTQTCVWTHPVVGLPLRLLYLAIWLLSLLKLAVAVRSRLRAPR